MRSIDRTGRCIGRMTGARIENAAESTDGRIRLMVLAERRSHQAHEKDFKDREAHEPLPMTRLYLNSSMSPMLCKFHLPLNDWEWLWRSAADDRFSSSAPKWHSAASP